VNNEELLQMTIRLTRRGFVKLLAGISAALFTASMAGAALRYLWPKGGEEKGGEEVRIASASEVGPRQIKMFKFNGKAAILIHTVTGFHAYGAVCTHLGCIVNYKEDENQMVCPCHLGVFDPETGDVISGPPPSKLPSIIISQKGDDIFAVAWKDPDYVASLEMYA
jgi:cytochrome b6-f complex iron-sulfur subunit